MQLTVYTFNGRGIWQRIHVYLWYKVEALGLRGRGSLFGSGKFLFNFASSPSLNAARPPSANVIDGAPLSGIEDVFPISLNYQYLAVNEK